MIQALKWNRLITWSSPSQKAMSIRNEPLKRHLLKGVLEPVETNKKVRLTKLGGNANFSHDFDNFSNPELLLHERMSIYVKHESSLNDSLETDTYQRVDDDAVQENEIEGGEQGTLDFDSDQDLEIHGDVDNVYDLYALDEEEEHFRPRLGSMSLTSVGTSTRSFVVLGPPQDADVRPKTRIPPQVHLARFEDKLHKFTQSLSMDKVFARTLSYRPHSPTDGEFRSVIDVPHDEQRKKRSKRIPLDAFDKRLGYRSRHSNPVTEIKSSFLGPLMRIFRILCCAVRVAFNVGVWNDPYMSFWVLCFLILTMIVLIMFPWRLFFLTVGIACFGPQVRCRIL